MAKGPGSRAAVGSASIREVKSDSASIREVRSDEVVTVREGSSRSRERDPEFAGLTDEELDQRLFEMRAEKQRLMGRLRAAVAEFDFRKTR